MNDAVRPLGFWMCTALVVGNMIGSGVFLLPTALAPFGWNAIIGWVVTIAGSLALAFVFARLARVLPRAGGPYVYVQSAFGPGLGFAVAWTYWLALVIGNAAIAVGSVSYLSVLFPVIGRVHALPPLLTLGSIWALTLLNCRGARSAGGFQIFTTLLKLVPLAAVLIVAAFALKSGSAHVIAPFHASDIHLSSVAAAATLTLWALLGLESATVPTDKVTDASRVIPKATLVGTAFTGLLYLGVCSAVMLLMPSAELATSPAPLADFLGRYWGHRAEPVLAAFAALSGFGALNGWVFLQGELPLAMARTGIFPRWFAQTSSNGTPVRAHLAASGVLTVTVMTNFDRSMQDLFTFIALLATTAALFAYLFTSLAALRLQARGPVPVSVLMSISAVVGAIYSMWAILGASAAAAVWGFVFLLSALPVYVAMNWRRRLLPMSEDGRG